MTIVSAVRVNPFPGLRPFESDEEHLFFGRETQIDGLLGRLRRTRFLAVVGTSGSGKSSLVRAGMLPSLNGGLMAGAGSRWRIALLRPGNEPLANLARALTGSAALGDPTSAKDLDAQLHVSLTHATLARGALGLVEAVQQARLDPDENVLVVVDQFEEIFRFKGSGSELQHADEAAAFVKLLLAAASHPTQSIYVALTMRSDFLGDCAQFRDLPETINDGQFLVPRMTRDQLRRAIEGPVGVAGGLIAPQLVTRLLNDLGEDPDQLPVLQHALLRSWNRWEADHAPDEPLDLRHYEATGDLSQALSVHADEIYAALNDDRSRQVAEKFFKCLTNLGSDNRGLRCPTRFRDACAIVGASADELRSVVDAFRAPGCCFLMPPAGVLLEEHTVLDISHESLMRTWTRLQHWVDEEAQSAQTYRRLAQAASLHAQEQAALWRDPDLSITLTWQQQTQPNAAWAERYDPAFDQAMQFLSGSAEARDKEIAARYKARRLREKGTLFAVAFIGLAPQAIVNWLGSIVDDFGLFTVIDLFVSVFWAVIFAIAFPSPNISIVRCLFCFFGAGVVGLVLFPLFPIWPPSALYAMAGPPLRVIGAILGFGVIQETCKALVLFVLWRRYGATLPNLMLFYGLISGLGFGVGEGVFYSPKYLNAVSGQSPLSQSLKVTTLLTTWPFLHAMWTGLAGYFIGLASLHPRRQVSLAIVAIAFPAVLNGLHAAFGGLPSLGVEMVSVVVLSLCLRGSDLRRERVAGAATRAST
jgi:RsiW-degrading membrane proteinase PrsW (M82 family)